jgi:hypothetical protein
MIYVVMGTTGEYSDRVEWPVKAFQSEEKAEKFINHLSLKYKTYPGGTTGYGFERGPDEEEDALQEYMEEFDPGFEEDYTGTFWYLFEVELKE